MQKTRRQFGNALAVGAIGTAAAAFSAVSKTVAQQMEVQEIEIFPEDQIGLIRPELHGQFVEHLGTCIYGGLWVGKNSTIPNVNGYRQAAIEYLRPLGVPVLRWPGGCFADDYHWRDGIGPAEQRPRTVNSNWGNYVEDNSFGTHEFMGLCQLLGAQPYLAGNVGSGSPKELRDWMEYCNYPAGSSLSDERVRNGAEVSFNVKYWGVGNEAWGCGGNLAGDEYAALYRRFGTFLTKFGETAPFLIACGPNRDSQEWTGKFLTSMHGKRLPDGYAMHFYSNSKVNAAKFTVDDMYAQFGTMNALEETILHQRRLMDEVDADKKMGLMVDEWGVWDRIIPEEERVHGRLWQQITMRAAVTTALGLNLFHRQADKLVMCNVAQMVNVLDAMLLTQNEKCIRTPAYYTFLLMKAHMGKVSIKATPPQANATELSISASRREDSLVVTLVNPRADATMRVRCAVRGRAVSHASGRSLFHGDLNAFNSFDKPDTVTPQKLLIDVRREGMLVDLPALSVSTIEVELKAA